MKRAGAAARVAASQNWRFSMLRDPVVGVGLAQRLGVNEQNRKWWTLGAVSFALFMIMLDNTIVNVALPSISRGLEVGVSQLEWVVNAYALALATFMLTGGRLADLYGRRLVFDVGLVVFTVSSLTCGLAPNAATLITARSLQGMGAALMMPATLSIISAVFPTGERAPQSGSGRASRAARSPSGRCSADW
jgi:MFS family permease